MTRSIAERMAYALFRHAATEKYPTRTVEHMLAWTVLVWSGAVLVPGHMLEGRTFEYLLLIAPEYVWGSAGVAIGIIRIVGLYLNGNWRRSPGLRFIGAMFGLIWWLILSALYWLAVNNGAPDFPIRYCLFVFIFFEGYSCFRCGQDHASPKARVAGTSYVASTNG